MSARRKTKIIATLGPAVASADKISELVASGMNVARLNFSHGDYESHRDFAIWVRQAADRAGMPIAIMQDIQGPRIRVGTFVGGSVVLETDTEVRCLPGIGESDGRSIHIENLEAARLEDGAPILMSDGLIKLEAVRRSGSDVVARVVSGGELHDHKGVAFPGTALDMPALTPKDENDLAFGQELEVDFVAVSFVSSAEDIRQVKKLAHETPVIAKIESAVGIANLDDILEESHGAMVARGDLGVELSFEAVPYAQKEILEKANARARVTITATEMLESMTNSPRPTRAEVTDVSNAVLDGSDAVMLSAETAIGKYPAETIQAMDTICRAAEQSEDYGTAPDIHFITDSARFASATARACVEAATNLGLDAIVAFTESGSTPRLISTFRPHADIYAYTPIERTYRRMALYAGVVSLMFERVESTDEMISYAEKHLLDWGIVDPGDGVVMAAGIPPNQAAATNLMKLHSIGTAVTGIPDQHRDNSD